ncbi:unnamed protein product [Closterium sp. NIES-53]
MPALTTGQAEELKSLRANTKRLLGPTVVLQLFGGIGTGLATLLKAGAHVEKRILVESDMEAAKITWCHAEKFPQRYAHQFCKVLMEASAACGSCDIRNIDEATIRSWGRIDVVISWWECQGYSRAGEGGGMQYERSRMFRELVRVLRLIKRVQGEVLYIVENVDMEGDVREKMQAAYEEVTAIMGPGVAADTAQAGCMTHRARRYWTNKVSESALQYRLSLMERPVPLFVEVILEVGRMPAPMAKLEHPTQFQCNVVGQPRQAWLTFVSFEETAAFWMQDGAPGPGMVYDCVAQEWQKLTALERELQMGFMEDTTVHREVTEKERRRALGRAMDLNAMHWLVATI